MKILVTGSSGFIGFHTSLKLLEMGIEVVGLDSMNQYYEPKLKEDRLAFLTGREGFSFYKMALAERERLQELFRTEKFDKVLNLAAQAGVRYSLENPYAYQESNLEGFLNILEACRQFEVKTLVYASSSSVYGKNITYPFSEKHNVDNPISLYAATKKANELMAHTYSHLFGLHTTGLRFFTVYGPWGRPDMALFLFTKAILEKRPIQVFNQGEMFRDFTYIDDIVSGIVASLEKSCPYEVFNLGNNSMEKLMDFIGCIEKELGMEAIKDFQPLQPGDVLKTCADISHAKEVLGYEPKTRIETGIQNFIRWYREYYRV